VLAAMGIDHAIAQSSIRISLDRFNTKEEMIITGQAIRDAIACLAPYKEKTGIGESIGKR
jgi:cysteine sulfinate desulfinase/cysteine desulfurase-like protein